MDPVAEQLHLERQERLASATVDREFLVGLIRTALFLIAAAALARVAGPIEIEPVALGAVIVTYVALWQAEYEVGPVSTTPVQLAFVAMWFAVSPAALPFAAAAAHLCGLVTDSVRLRRSPRGFMHAGLCTIGDAWYSLGPAVVLATFGVSAPSMDVLPVLVLAVAAQFAFDVASIQVRVLLRAASAIPARELAWAMSVDLALAPLGLLTALAMTNTPYAPLLAVPLAGILTLFAKERDERINQALELSSAYRGTARLMGDVLEADDAYTGGEHTQGVVGMALALGNAAGLNARQMRDLEFGALLHDIGKLRVPNEIINKPGKLTDQEWAIIKKHPGYGQEMLDRVGGQLSRVGVIVRAHHERWDGAGYPDGLRAEEIPVEARIITICDSFSAMTTDRSYRKGMSTGEAVAELERCSATQFDPTLVELAKRAFGVEAELRVVTIASPASATKAKAQAA